MPTVPSTSHQPVYMSYVVGMGLRMEAPMSSSGARALRMIIVSMWRLATWNVLFCTGERLTCYVVGWLSLLTILLIVESGEESHTKYMVEFTVLSFRH